MSHFTLIGPNDPPPFELINPGGTAETLLVCDHASHAVPEAMERLGLAENVIQDHIGWDIGAAELSRQMANLLDAPALLAGYSRLLIDCNRPPEAPDRIPSVSDGVVIPANQSLDPMAIAARVETFFQPYHDAIREAIVGMLARGVMPSLVAVHSFTPVMGGIRRPWHVSVCWERDRRIAKPLVAALRQEPETCVGDNEPYAIEPLTDFTIPEHGARRGLPHVLIEVRNDQIRSADGIQEWAQYLCRSLMSVLADPGTRRVEQF